MNVSLCHVTLINFSKNNLIKINGDVVHLFNLGGVSALMAAVGNTEKQSQSTTFFYVINLVHTLFSLESP